MPAAPKITVSVAGNTVTVSDGKRTRQASCASRSSAKGLGTKLSRDAIFAVKWMRSPEPVQLELPLGDDIALSGNSTD